MAGQDERDEELTEFLRTSMPFTATLDAYAVAASPEEVRLRVDADPARSTLGGAMHGGALMALADAAGAWCAYLHLPEGATTTTVDSTTHFLRAVTSGYAEAVARPLHVGRTIVVVDTEVRDAAGRLVARTSQTQAVLGAR